MCLSEMAPLRAIIKLLTYPSDVAVLFPQQMRAATVGPSTPPNAADNDVFSNPRRVEMVNGVR